LSRPIYGIAIISISSDQPISRSGAADRAEFRFGAVDATAELEYGGRIIFFHWSGFDQGDAIGGDGSAELQDDDSLEIELSFDDGDDAVLTPPRNDFFNSLLGERVELYDRPRLAYSL
jgi:hypothetical protein